MNKTSFLRTTLFAIILLGSPALFAASAIPVSADEENLVTNSSLEAFGTVDNPMGWWRGGWGENERMLSTIDVDDRPAELAARVEINAYTDGDVKWYFEPIAVEPGENYVFRDDYRSNAETDLVLCFMLLDGSFQYQYLGSVPAAADWTQTSYEFMAPENATTVTVFHLLRSVGWLETDYYSLVLNHDIAHVPDQLIVNPSLEAVGENGDPEKWLRGGWGVNDALFTYPILGTHGTKAARVEMTNYTDGDAKWYFEDVQVLPDPYFDYYYTYTYRADTPTDVVVRFTHDDGTISYTHIWTLDPASEWTDGARFVTVPPGVRSLTIFHVLHSVGWLEVDNFGISYMSAFG